MDTKVYCKICDRREVPGDHDVDGVKVRDWLQGWTRRDGPVAVAEKPVTPATKPRAESKSFVACAAVGCNNPVQPTATGRPGKYCSDPCRKKAFRASRKR